MHTQGSHDSVGSEDLSSTPIPCSDGHGIDHVGDRLEYLPILDIYSTCNVFDKAVKWTKFSSDRLARIVDF